MATTGRKQVAPGGLIQSAAWGNPLWDQSLQCFNSAADRDNQYPAGSWHAGAQVWLDDLKQVQVYTGTAWRVVHAELGTTGNTLAGVAFDPTKHRQATYVFRTSVTTNAFGQINVPISGLFLGYVAAHVQPYNRPWFGTIDFSNAPSMSAFLLVMRDTAGVAANQAVDLCVTIIGWK
jgi:hypothetical protein